MNATNRWILTTPACWLLSAGLLVSSLACRTAPITGRNQLLFLPEEQEVTMGATAFQEVVGSEKPSHPRVVHPKGIIDGVPLPFNLIIHLLSLEGINGADPEFLCKDLFGCGYLPRIRRDDRCLTGKQ